MMDNIGFEELASGSLSSKRSEVSAYTSTSFEAPENTDTIVEGVSELDVSQNLRSEKPVKVCYVGAPCGRSDGGAQRDPVETAIQGYAGHEKTRCDPSQKVLLLLDRMLGCNASKSTFWVTFELPDSPLFEHIQRLPVELLAHIMSFLPLNQLILIQRVSQQWLRTVKLRLSMIRSVNLRTSFRFIDPDSFDDALLKRILCMLSGLTRIKTRGCVRSCSQDALFVVADCCPNLEELNLKEFTVTERGLKHLCSHCPKLEEVILSEEDHLDEASIRTILCNSKSLLRLDLKKSNRVTGKCFSVLPSSIRHLVLRECSKLKSSYLAILGERGENLQRLDVSGLRQMSLEDCCTMLAGMSGLRSLTMGNLCLPVDQCIESVGKTLTCLDLTSSELSDHALKRSAPMLPQLSSLELEGCHRLTESGLLHLVKFQKLGYLGLNYIRTVSDSVLDSLLQLSSLSSLSLCESSAGPAKFTAAGLTRLIVGSRLVTQLDIGGVSSMTTAVARAASTQLCASRKLDVLAGGTPVFRRGSFARESLDDDLHYGGICVTNYNSVPNHLRRIDDEMDTDYDALFSDSEIDSDDFNGSYGCDDDDLYEIMYDDECYQGRFSDDSD